MNTPFNTANEPKDEYLMRIARKRVGFQKHAIVYVIVCAMISGLCLLSAGKIPANLWLWWGFGLAFHGLGAYAPFDERRAAEKEYQKLLKEK